MLGDGEEDDVNIGLSCGWVLVRSVDDGLSVLCWLCVVCLLLGLRWCVCVCQVLSGFDII